MGHATKPIRHNRTITVDFRDETTYCALLGNTKAFVEFVFAFFLTLGFQLLHKASCSEGGCLTRHSHYARVRLGGLTIWRIQCTTCKVCLEGRIALDMMRESRAEGREQTTEALHQARRGFA